MNCTSAGSRRTYFLIALCLAVLASHSNAAPIVIDNFDANTLDPAYTMSVVFNGGNSSVGTYDTTTTTDKLTWSFTASGSTNAKQWALLRDDFGLTANGDQVWITARVEETGGNNTHDLFGGLAISTTKTPPPPPPPGGNGVMLSIWVDANGNVIVQDGLTQTQPFNSSLGPNPISNAVPPGTDAILRFTRLTATSVAADYSTNGGLSFLSAGTHAVQPGGFTAIGVHNGNARGNLGIAVFDNLTYSPIPEPSSLLMLSMTMIALLRFGRAKRT